MATTLVGSTSSSICECSPVVAAAVAVNTMELALGVSIGYQKVLRSVGNFRASYSAEQSVAETEVVVPANGGTFNVGAYSSLVVYTTGPLTAAVTPSLVGAVAYATRINTLLTTDDPGAMILTNPGTEPLRVRIIKAQDPV